MKVIIVGAGGHGKVVCDALLEAQLGEPVGFVDDDPAKEGTSVLGFSVLGDFGRLPAPSTVVLAMGIGDNPMRRRLFVRARGLGYSFVTVVHPSVVMGRDCVVGIGSVVFARVTINAGTRVGENAILNTACMVDHDCEIGAHAHVAPGAVLTGDVGVGEQAFVGAGAVVIPGCRIGDRTVVGAGAVVTADLPADCTARGIPARIARSTGKEQ